MGFRVSQDNYALEVFESMNQIEDMRSSLLNWFKLNGRHWIPWKVKSDGNVPKIQEKLPVYPIWVAVFGFALCILLTYLINQFIVKKLGGITGDILGATEQTCEMGFLLLFAAIWGVA